MGHGLISRLEGPRSHDWAESNFGVRSSLVAGALSYPVIALVNSIGSQTLWQSFTSKQTLISAALIIPVKMFYNYYFGQEAHPRIGPRLVDALGTGIALSIPLMAANYFSSNTGLEYMLKTGSEIGVIGAAKFTLDSVGDWLGDRAGWS